MRHSRERTSNVFMIVTLTLIASSFVTQPSFAFEGSENKIVGIWEGPKLDGRTNMWEPFGPYEIKRNTNGTLAVTYLGSRTGERDHEMQKVTFEDDKIRMQWNNWAGWVFEAKFTKDETLEGHLHHHGMSEKFTLRKEITRSNEEIIAEFASDKKYKQPPSQSQFFSIMLNEGPEVAMRIYETVKRTDPDYVLFGAASMNNLGYRLLSEGKTGRAVEVLKFNVLEYADDPNAYDSLGEAYVKNGDRELAIKALRKSLSMSPPPRVKANSIRLLKGLGIDYKSERSL